MMLKKVSRLLLVIILLNSCNHKVTNYEKIETFIKKNFNKDLNGYDYLIVINEQGDCLNCNNKFSVTLSKYLDNNNVLYLVSTPGFNIDVSPYIKKDHSNVLLDYNNEFSKLDLVKKCAIIDFGTKKIDTIIQVDVSNIKSTLNTFTPHPSP